MVDTPAAIVIPIRHSISGPVRKTLSGRAVRPMPTSSRCVTLSSGRKEVGTMQTMRETEFPQLERLEPIHTTGLQRVVGLLRLAMGWTFLWAFLDKAFALGFSTGRVLDDAGQTVRIDFFGDGAWINGASPTAGAVGFALKGPFADAIQTVTGYQMTQTGPQVAGWLDWVYMLSMLLVGLGLILGIGTRLAAIGGIAWLAIFYAGTAIWPEHNPFLDDHVVYAVILVGLILANAGRYYGLGKAWQRIGFVQGRRYLY
jgi:thiosulfate dehydrogenase [quinone] large subunit